MEDADTLLKQKWERFSKIAGFKSRDSKAIFALLDSLYREPQRHYHNWNHIMTLDMLFKGWEAYIQNPVAFEAAVWFHDAVYIPGRKDNEENSAYLAECILCKSALDEKARTESINIILSTKYTGKEENIKGDIALFHDLDFAIFAFPLEQVLTYDRNIHGEFLSTGKLSEIDFNRNRCRFLQTLLQSPPIFKFKETMEAWEEKARINIEYLLTKKYQVTLENL